MSINSKKFVNPEVWDNTSDFDGIGNFGMADTPGLTAAEQQKVMDILPRRIATRINEIIDALASVVDGDSGADSIGITPVAGSDAATVQALLEEIANGNKTKIAHGTAEPTGGSDGDVYIQHS